MTDKAQHLIYARKLAAPTPTHERSIMIRQVYVCSKCGRTVMNEHNWTRGWLIDSHRDAEKRDRGEMVIRCPNCITNYAVRKAQRGRAAIRAA